MGRGRTSRRQQQRWQCLVVPSREYDVAEAGDQSSKRTAVPGAPAGGVEVTAAVEAMAGHTSQYGQHALVVRHALAVRSSSEGSGVLHVVLE